MNVTKRYKKPFLELITRRSQVQVLSPQPTKATQMRGFFLLPVLWQALPRSIAAGIFLFRRQENCQTKKHKFFHGRGAGQHKHKNRTHKKRRCDDDYHTFDFIRPCFLHTGPERGTCFFRGLSAAAFSSLLVFSQQCFPGVFHFPLFFCRDLRGGPKRRPNPLSAVPFMGISPPASGPRTPPKTSGKMTG